MAEYVIKEVIPKSGKMLEIHEEVLGRRCYILALEKNQRGFIKFEPSYDPGRLHRLHTSTVMDITEAEDGSQISIETANTTYVLERIRENTALYNHGWQFSREEAMDDIIKYLSAQDEEYFTERETTKSKVLSDDTILADLRDEHYKCVMNFGNDRDWSCRDACDNDPGIVR